MKIKNISLRSELIPAITRESPERVTALSKGPFGENFHDTGFIIGSRNDVASDYFVLHRVRMQGPQVPYPRVAPLSLNLLRLLQNPHR